jgi:TonB family protein
MRRKAVMKLALLPIAIVVIVLCGMPIAYSQVRTAMVVSPELLTAIDSADAGLSPDSFQSADVMPEMVSQVAPVYPSEEKSKGIEAVVWIKALIGRSGSVLKATVMKPEPGTESFQKAALDAAIQNRFKPATVKDKPVPVWVTYQVSFVLSDKTAAPKSPDGKK